MMIIAKCSVKLKLIDTQIQLAFLLIQMYNVEKIKSILLEMKTGGGMDNDFEVALFNQMFI